jgi:TetR/AcrR family transcriptional repressor of nem operon
VLASLSEADPTDPKRSCLVVGAAAQCSDQSSATDRIATAIRLVESLPAGALERAQVRGELSPERDLREPARCLTTFIQAFAWRAGRAWGVSSCRTP